MNIIYISRETRNIKIYVNGKQLSYSWNNFNSVSDALIEINKGNIIGCNVLIDNVEIREEVVTVFDVDSIAFA